MDAKRFSLWTCAMVAIAFLVISTLNYIVNPYAQYGSDYFRPIVQESRLQKVQLLSKLTETPPKGLVLGSSRVLKVEPDYLQEKTGVKFFNAGVNYGKPEDFLAIYRYYKQNHGPLQRLVIGIDPIALSDVEPTDARLLGTRELASQIPEFLTIEDRWKRWSDLLSWNQTKFSIKTLKANISGQAETHDDSFRSDGLIVYHRREQELREGTYDFQDAINYNKNEYKHFYLRAKKLSERRCRAFASLLTACKQDGTQLHVFVTPHHPELVAHLSQIDGAEDFKNNAIRFARELTAQQDATFRDLSTVDKFDGDPDLFVDGIHPLEPNTRRMLDAVLMPEQWGQPKYAIQ